MKTKLIDLLGLTNMANDIRDWVNAHFQRKVDGKGLSTYDYDKTAKDKVDAIPADPQYTDTTYEAGEGISIENNVISATGSGGEDNVIEAITMNGASVPITNKTAAITETDPTVPSWAKQPNKPSYNYSEIGNTPDLSGFITKSVNDLTNYYLKSETYTKSEVQTLIDAIKQFTYESVASLPTASSNTMHKIYLVPSADPQTSNVKDEYITIESSGSYSWEQIGDTSIDLSGYVTTSDLNTALAGYVTVQDLNDSKVFWVEAFVTTFAEIKDAVDAGRTVLLKDEDNNVYVLSHVEDDNISFCCASGEYAFLNTCYIDDGDAYEFVSREAIESQNNKVISISSSSDYDHYPSAKAVWDIVSTKYTKPQSGIPASDLASGVIPTVPVQDVTVGGTSVVSNGTAVIPAIPDTSDFEASANKVSIISGNETNTTNYPNTKAVADALGKWGVVSQTQTWSDTGSQLRTYVMSDLVYGTIPQANIDLFESAGATFNATTGYFELNGLTDISYEEMKVIYNKSIDNLTIRSDRQYQYYAVKDLRTLLPFYFNTYTGIQANWNSILGGGTRIETISSADAVKFANTSSTMFRDCTYLKSILFILNFVNKTSSDSLSFRNCYSLENVLIQNLKINIDLKESALLQKESILYMINNVDTSATGIVVTLHSTVYSKCTTGGDWYNDVNSALSNHTNITLASA